MKIALLGADGKMDVQLAANLEGSCFEVAPVEVWEPGHERRKQVTGFDCLPLEAALAGAADVPDTATGRPATRASASSRPAPWPSRSTPRPPSPATGRSATTSPAPSLAPAIRRYSTRRPIRRRGPGARFPAHNSTGRTSHA